MSVSSSDSKSRCKPVFSHEIPSNGRKNIQIVDRHCTILIILFCYTLYPALYINGKTTSAKDEQGYSYLVVLISVSGFGTRNPSVNLSNYYLDPDGEMASDLPMRLLIPVRI